MSKAVVREDFIINITERGNIEIGNLPKNVGLERLRWDGEKIIDLATIDQMWVRPIGIGFELHAIKVSDSYLVDMTWQDKNNLTINNGVVRLKTAQEIQDEKIARHNQEIKDRLRGNLREKIGDIEDQFQNALILIASLIVYARTQDATIGQFFDDLRPHIIDMFPAAKVKPIVLQAMKDLKAAMEEYYANIQ